MKPRYFLTTPTIKPLWAAAVSLLCAQVPIHAAPAIAPRFHLDKISSISLAGAEISASDILTYPREIRALHRSAVEVD